MEANELALVQGVHDTRATLGRWRRGRWRIVETWVGWSALVALTLLAAVYAIAALSAPDPTRVDVPGVYGPAGLGDVGRILLANGLVLALHALACVAGFIAGSSLPQSARAHRGAWRWVHERAGPLAIGFVVAATTFSLFSQAHVLGGWAATLATSSASARRCPCSRSHPTPCPS